MSICHIEIQGVLRFENRGSRMGVIAFPIPESRNQNKSLVPTRQLLQLLSVSRVLFKKEKLQP